MRVEYIAVNTQTLNADINDIKEALNEAMNQADNMFNEIMQLSMMWEGSAHDAFTAQFNIDYENMENLFKTISELIDCMGYAKKEYNSCESTVGMIVSSIRV